MIAEGRLGPGYSAPLLVGSEFAGRIVEAGNAVTHASGLATA